MSKDRRKYSAVRLLLRTIPIQFKAAPLQNIVHHLSGMCQALTITARIIVTQMLFDTVTRAAAGKAGFADCVWPLIILMGANLAEQIFSGLYNFMFDVSFGKSKGPVKALLQRKMQRVDPAQFENTAFLDDLNRAREGAEEIPNFGNFLFIFVFFYLTYFVSVGAYLFWLNPLLLITLLIAFMPALLSQMVRARLFTILEQESAPLRRENEYYQKTLCDREYYKETRILGVFGFFRKLFDETLSLLTHKRWRVERKNTLLQLTLDVTTFAGMGVSAYLLLDATLVGEITIGAFVAVLHTLYQLFSIMREILVDRVNGMNENIGKVANYLRVLDMPEITGATGTPDLSKGVSVDHVTFTYTGRGEPAVKDVSLTIAPGETVAIVGENGAGKTTLVRLLTGIYRPSEGKVMVGGLDTAETVPSSIFNNTSGVFQKYQRYKMTLEENITISDAISEANTDRIQSALFDASAELADVNLDTMLSPEFDGIDLSGGQWQRLAIARGLYRINGFIVLDEPTAAIDPIEETHVYTQFEQLAAGKCAVVVTHRLGSAKLAHRIVVMDGGRIVDIGTHEELLTRPGKYANMWKAQTQWYERKVVPMR